MIDLELTQQLTKLKVLVIGDSCTDEYKIGSVERLSPEAPVPVIKITETFSIPGMAANVELNLRSLGIDNVEFISNKEIITKTRYIDKRSGQHLLRVDSEPDIISQWDYQTAYPLNHYDAIIISDYNKGFLTYNHIEWIIRYADIPVFIDTKKQDLLRFSADNVYVKINELEYKNRLSRPKNLIVTLGAQGSRYQTLNNEKLFPTRSVDVVDVCGCGDTFLAALAIEYLLTNNIEDAIIFANVAAGITVQHRGNYAPKLEEILNGY